MLISQNINFVSKKYYAFAFSFILTIGTIIGLITKGVNLGIDFAGGILIEFSSNDSNLEALRNHLTHKGYEGINIQEYQESSGQKNIMIRLLPNDEVDVAKIKSLIIEVIPDSNFERIDYVGPKVGNDFIINAINAIMLALVIMMLYTWIRFEWQFSIGVMCALFHDAIAVIGFYIVTGYEFDLTSIAALLTIIGYSINDSVVIYDRIRDNLKKYKKEGITNIINMSINETMSRTIMTAATTLLVCLMLVIFGGSTLRGFSAATLFGIAFGTYSSIYISALMLTLFKKPQL